jgi:CBS domain-containing protein
MLIESYGTRRAPPIDGRTIASGGHDGNTEQATPRRRKAAAVRDTVGSILDRKGKEIWQVSPAATVYDAIAEMAERAVGALPVVSEGQLVGMISERDCARKVILQGKSSQHTQVQEIMTPSPITVTPDYTVDQCMRIMTRYHVRHLPVVDLGSMVGIVSIGDLVNAIISSQAFTIDQLQMYIASDYPA